MSSIRVLAAACVLFAAQFTSTASADELMYQFSQKQQQQQQQGQQQANPERAQDWLSICLLNATDAKLVAYFQFGYNPKEEKWRKLTLGDGAGLMVAQTFLTEIGAPKVWVKYEGADAESSWVKSLDGKISEAKPKTCSDAQRVAFLEETDGNVSLKILE